MAIRHYYPQTYNLEHFIGKAIISHSVVFSVPDEWLETAGLPPVTVTLLNKAKNDEILKNGFYVLDIDIYEEPANFLFFKNKYTIISRFYPHTEKAKAETAKIKTIEYNISQEDVDRLSTAKQ